jgi:sodium pump decarboxylase gamma subunit
MLVLANQAEGWLSRITVEPLFEDYGIPLAIMGIVVVFAALVLVSAFITLLPRLMAALDYLHPEQKEPQPAAAKQPDAEDELSEELMVVIAAAVAETLSEPHRIVRIRGLTPEDLGWSMEGRFQHHASHQIQRRDRR